MYECNSCGEVCNEFEVRKTRKGQTRCPLCGSLIHPQEVARKNAEKSYNKDKAQREIRSASVAKANELGIPVYEARELVLAERRRLKGKPARKIRAFGQEKTPQEWVDSEVCVVGNPGALMTRIYTLGWDPEKALTTPVKRMKRRPRC